VVNKDDTVGHAGGETVDVTAIQDTTKGADNIN